MLPKLHCLKLLRPTACLLFSLFVFAGFLFTPVVSSNSTKLKQDLDRHFLQHQIVKLDSRTVTAQVLATGRMSLVIADTSFDLDLTPHDMRGAGYRAEEFRADGVVQTIDSELARTFRGNAYGTEKGEKFPQVGEARFTIDENTIEGLIITPAENYFVE